MRYSDTTESDEFDNLFQKMLRPFKGINQIWENMKNPDDVQTFGPYYYGYSMSLGPSGKPIIKEYGNVRPGLISTSETREPFVDVIVDDKEKVLKVVAEMPGIEKNDIDIEVIENSINIEAENNNKKYQTTIQIKHEVDEDSAKATYSNGILELRFKLKQEGRPQRKKVTVE